MLGNNNFVHDTISTTYTLKYKIVMPHHNNLNRKYKNFGNIQTCKNNLLLCVKVSIGNSVRSSELKRNIPVKKQNPRVHIEYRSIKVDCHKTRPICDVLVVISGRRLGRLVYFSGVIVMWRRRTLPTIIFVVVTCTEVVTVDVMRLFCRNHCRARNRSVVSIHEYIRSSSDLHSGF